MLEMTREAAAMMMQEGGSPDFIYVHPRTYQRIIETMRYVEAVGPRVAQLSSKQRARLMARYSNGRHAHKKTRRERRRWMQ